MADSARSQRRIMHLSVQREREKEDRARAQVEENSMKASLKTAEIELALGKLVSTNESLGQLIDPRSMEVAFRLPDRVFGRLLDDSGALSPHPVEVTLSLGDTQLATGAVDPTIVDTTDEVGRASLTFTVPEGVYGEQLLTVAVAGTGTTAQLPFTISGEAAGEFAGTIALGSSKVGAGKKLQVTGEGYLAGETVTVVLESKKGEPVEVGTVVVGDDGTFSTSVVIPKNTKPGKHTVTVAQADGDAASASVVVNRSGGKEKNIVEFFDDLFAEWF